MVPTADVAVYGQRINLFNFFVTSEWEQSEQSINGFDSYQTSTVDPLSLLFEKSEIVSLIDFRITQAETVFQADQLVVKFRLSNAYRNYFSLFRGLLEFSRPRGISIFSNSSKKTFELFLVRNQSAVFAGFLNIQQDSLINEIKFKKSLRAVLRFEEDYQKRQRILYQELTAFSR